MAEGYVSFYEGGYSSLSPSYSPNYNNFIGYRISGGTLSSTTSGQSANQVSEVLSRIREGVKNVELQPIFGGVIDTIPKQHLQEIRAIMKLTGVKPSFHAPMEDTSGFGERGYEGEKMREINENKFISVLEKAKEIDPEGNIPIVIHSTGGVPGPTFFKGDEKKGEPKFKIIEQPVINRETGQMIKVKEETVYYPEYYEELNPNKGIEEQGKLKKVEEIIDNQNYTTWINELRGLVILQKELEENLNKSVEKGAYYLKDNTQEEYAKIAQKEAIPYLERAGVFAEEIELQIRNLFNKAYEYGNEEQRKELIEKAKEWEKERKNFIEKIKKEEGLKKNIEFLGFEKEFLNKKLHDIREITEKNPPKIYVPVEEFAMEKAAKTFGNVAWEGYSRWKEKAPIIAIENLFPGMAFSRAEDMKKLVEMARENFIKKAKEKGFSESEAKEKAEKFIGITWDVGHLNIMKKHGFTDKEIVEETKKIKDLVKHVHLTDNFGYNDSHLAPGMGNVPIKEILKELEKNGDFDKMMKVIESGGLTNPNMGLRMSPFKATLGAFGPQIYSGGSYWNQIENVSGNYFSFPLAYMPEKHFSIYGSSFASLPEELGGQIPGTQSRFSGTPNV